MNLIELQSPVDLQLSQENFENDVLSGLSHEPKCISSKYFYDDRGSELFQKITSSRDYYLTRSELEIIKNIKSLLPQKLDPLKSLSLIELGAGDGHKSMELISGFLEAQWKINYYPIDISKKAMGLLEKNLIADKNLKTRGIVGEYIPGLRYLKDQTQHTQLVLFLGSNIGNMPLSDSKVFLRQLWNSLNPGDYCLVGFDLKKSIETLTKAYNDSNGYTKAFNLNLLQRMNSELGADFDLAHFEHYGFYNPRLGAMESYLVSLKAQEVFIKKLNKKFSFKAFEPIHLEYSFKYSETEVIELAELTGFQVIENYFDSNKKFTDSLWLKT